MRRMLFAWLVICPKDELPNAELAGEAHCTMFSMFSTSILAFSVVPLPVWNAFDTDRSTLFRHGE